MLARLTPLSLAARCFEGFGREGSAMMTVSQLIDAVVANTGFPKPQVALTLRAFETIIPKAMEKEGGVIFGDLGKFTVAERAPGRAKNFRTGDWMDIPGRKIPKFTAMPRFKRRIEGIQSPEEFNSIKPKR